MSTLFSGFTTKQQQQLYDHLIEQLISILCKRIKKVYDGSECNENAFKTVLLKIMQTINQLEDKKYTPPKLSNYVKDLMQTLQLENTSTQFSNNDYNGIKQKKHILINQADIVTKKANILMNKGRSVTPMSVQQQSKNSQNKEIIANMSEEQNRINMSNYNLNQQEKNLDKLYQSCISPNNQYEQQKNGIKVQLFNKKEEFNNNSNQNIKNGFKEEKTKNLNQQQNNDIYKEQNINIKDLPFVNCYESINVKKCINKNNLNKNNLSYNEQTQFNHTEENNDIYYQPNYSENGKRQKCSRSNQLTSLSSPTSNKTQFQNSFDGILQKIDEFSPTYSKKVDLFQNNNYGTLSSQKANNITHELDCPQPSINFPTEQISKQFSSEQRNINTFNISNFDNKLNQNNMNEQCQEQTRKDQEMIKKIINIAPQIGKLNKQERFIEKSFKKLRKKLQQPNISISNENTEGLEFDIEKLEHDYYSGNFQSSTTSALSNKNSESSRGNRKNGFLSVQRNHNNN